MITVQLNGKPFDLDDPVTVEQLLERQGANCRFVAVARNGEVVNRSDFGTQIIADGDDLEILRPVSGG